jgi:hypothetical protein
LKANRIPELVEGLPFFPMFEEEGQGFDKLSHAGFQDA